MPLSTPDREVFSPRVYSTILDAVAVAAAAAAV